MIDRTPTLLLLFIALVPCASCDHGTTCESTLIGGTLVALSRNPADKAWALHDTTLTLHSYSPSALGAECTRTAPMGTSIHPGRTLTWLLTSSSLQYIEPCANHHSGIPKGLHPFREGDRVHR